MQAKSLVHVEIREVMDAILRAVYGIWDSSLQGSCSVLYLLFEYVICLNIQTHKYAPLVLYDSQDLIGSH